MAADILTNEGTHDINTHEIGLEQNNTSSIFWIEYIAWLTVQFLNKVYGDENDFLRYGIWHMVGIDTRWN